VENWLVNGLGDDGLGTESGAFWTGAEFQDCEIQPEEVPNADRPGYMGGAHGLWPALGFCWMNGGVHKKCCFSSGVMDCAGMNEDLVMVIWMATYQKAVMVESVWGCEMEEEEEAEAMRRPHTRLMLLNMLVMADLVEECKMGGESIVMGLRGEFRWM
jgi:hypothetical protein